MSDFLNFKLVLAVNNQMGALCMGLEDFGHDNQTSLSRYNLQNVSG